MTTWPGVLAALREEQRRKPHPTPSAPAVWRRWCHASEPFDGSRRARVVAAVAKLGRPSRVPGSPTWRDIANEAGVAHASVHTFWREAVKRNETEGLS